MKMTAAEMRVQDRIKAINEIIKNLNGFEPININGALSRIYCPKCKEHIIREVKGITDIMGYIKQLEEDNEMFREIYCKK